MSTPARGRGLRTFAGLGVLAAVAAGLLGFQLVRGEPDVVTGQLGGEKEGLLADPEVQQILRDEYDLVVDYEVEGSLDMVRQDTPSGDFLWPSSEVALALWEQRNGSADDANIFNSPIVLYSWDSVTTALESEGIVTRDGQVYEMDLAALADVIEQQRSWEELGLGELYGSVIVQTTDPVRSNSGNMFSGLLATTLNDGQVVNEQTVGAVLPQIESLYSRLGNLENSSGDLFASFLQTGVGNRPLIAGYENQLIEFGLSSDDERIRALVQERVRILYPQPTVWSSHPLIPLTPEGERLRDALLDEDIQRLAWERHGFRAGTSLGEEDPALVDFIGIPPTIDAVVQMPSPDVMERITGALDE